MDDAGRGPGAGRRPRLGPASRVAAAWLAALLLLAAATACGGKRKPPGGDAGLAASRTARALDQAGLAALAEVILPGQQVEVVRRGPDFGAIVRVGDLRATVTISPCVTCTPLDAARWEAERPGLTTLLAPAAGDQLAIDRVERGGWPLIEVRARRTIEREPQVVVLALWNDGVTQLIASCEHAGGDETERACVSLVEAAALTYLPVLVR